MTSVYILLLVNCTLCFACVYFANYGSESLFELLLLSESLGKYNSLSLDLTLSLRKHAHVIYCNFSRL